MTRPDRLRPGEARIRPVAPFLVIGAAVVLAAALWPAGVRSGPPTEAERITAAREVADDAFAKAQEALALAREIRGDYPGFSQTVAQLDQRYDGRYLGVGMAGHLHALARAAEGGGGGASLADVNAAIDAALAAHGLSDADLVRWTLAELATRKAAEQSSRDDVRAFCSGPAPGWTPGTDPAFAASGPEIVGWPGGPAATGVGSGWTAKSDGVALGSRTCVTLVPSGKRGAADNELPLRWHVVSTCQTADGIVREVIDTSTRPQPMNGWRDWRCGASGLRPVELATSGPPG